MSEKTVKCEHCGIKYYERVCKGCGKDFNTTNPKQLYCSRSCSQKGKYYTKYLPSEAWSLLTPEQLEAIRKIKAKAQEKRRCDAGEKI